jgi:hypothetical protein
MGFASGYNAGQVVAFVHSLRAVGFNGTLVLGIESAQRHPIKHKELHKLFARCGFHTLSLTRCALGALPPIVSHRLPPRHWGPRQLTGAAAAAPTQVQRARGGPGKHAADAVRAGVPVRGPELSPTCAGLSLMRKDAVTDADASRTLSSGSPKRTLRDEGVGWQVCGLSRLGAEAGAGWWARSGVRRARRLLPEQPLRLAAAGRRRDAGHVIHIHRRAAARLRGDARQQSPRARPPPAVGPLHSAL